MTVGSSIGLIDPRTGEITFDAISTEMTFFLLMLVAALLIGGLFRKISPRLGGWLDQATEFARNRFTATTKLLFAFIYPFFFFGVVLALGFSLLLLVFKNPKREAIAREKLRAAYLVTLPAIPFLVVIATAMTGVYTPISISQLGLSWFFMGLYFLTIEPLTNWNEAALDLTSRESNVSPFV